MSTPTTDRAAISQIIDGLLQAGWVLDSVDDGGDDISVTSKGQALEAIMAVDSAHLHVYNHANLREGAVWFVLGNEPEEVAADYTVNLSEAIDPVVNPWWE